MPMLAGMHPEDALIVITLSEATGTLRADRPLWEALDERLRTAQLGQVAGYTSGHGRHEVQVLADRVSWEEAWNVVRGTLTRHGLLGAASVHLQVPDEPSQQILWPPP